MVEFRVAGAAGQDSTYGSYRARGQRGGADAARRALALDPVCAEGVAPASAAGATGAACEAWDVAWVARPEGWSPPPPSLLLPLPMSLLYTPSVDNSYYNRYYTGLGNPAPRGEARPRPNPKPPARPPHLPLPRRPRCPTPRKAAGAPLARQALLTNAK